MRTLISFVCGLYIGAGLFAGLLTGAAIPALNVAGKTYIAVTWPLQIYCAPVSRGCSPMPPERFAPFMFTFKPQGD